MDLKHRLTKKIGYDPLEHNYFSNVRNKFGKRIREILSIPLIPLNPKLTYNQIIKHKFHKKWNTPIRRVLPINGTEKVGSDSYSIKELNTSIYNPTLKSPLQLNRVKQNFSTNRIHSQDFHYSNNSTETGSRQKFWKKNSYKDANIIKNNMQLTELFKTFNNPVRCMKVKTRKKTEEITHIRNLTLTLHRDRISREIVSGKMKLSKELTRNYITILNIKAKLHHSNKSKAKMEYADNQKYKPIDSDA